MAAYEAVLVTVTDVDERSADFDIDGDVDGADFLTWQRGFGLTVGATRADGDADDDSDVDADDWEVWAATYGEMESTLLSARSSIGVDSVEAEVTALQISNTALVDVAL